MITPGLKTQDTPADRSRGIPRVEDSVRLAWAALPTRDQQTMKTQWRHFKVCARLCMEQPSSPCLSPAAASPRSVQNHCLHWMIRCLNNGPCLWAFFKSASEQRLNACMRAVSPPRTMLHAKISFAIAIFQQNPGDSMFLCDHLDCFDAWVHRFERDLASVPNRPVMSPCTEANAPTQLLDGTPYVSPQFPTQRYLNRQFKDRGRPVCGLDVYVAMHQHNLRPFALVVSNFQHKAAIVAGKNLALESIVQSVQLTILGHSWSNVLRRNTSHSDRIVRGCRSLAFDYNANHGLCPVAFTQLCRTRSRSIPRSIVTDLRAQTNYVPVDETIPTVVVFSSVES